MNRWLDFLLMAMAATVIAIFFYQRGERAGLHSAPSFVAYMKEFDASLEDLISQDCEFKDETASARR